jgi:predicted RNase H-like HicB family nuclease
MNTYLALVHKDEDSAYGVSFPDLPGCFSAADDFDGIISAASEALDLWFETEPLVEPRSIEEVRQDVAADLADGAFLVAMPYVRRSTKQVRVNISMDAGTLDAIDTAANQMRLTRSSFLALAATNEIRGINR